MTGSNGQSRLNDVRSSLPAQLAASTTATASGADRSERIFIHDLRLPGGRHDLEVRAYNGINLLNFNRLSGTISSTYATLQKPKLHAVVVGINDYENANLKLRYAVGDANAVAQLLERQLTNSGLYSGGQVVKLTTKAQTSKASITQALQDLHQVSRVGADDVFILYVAGHGSYDADRGRYHMFSSDVLQLSEERLPVTSIGDEELQALVRNVPAQKKLVLLDTCDSGGAFERLGAQAFMGRRGGLEEQSIIKNMKNRTGATILAASNKQQAALEGHEGHGVFTWAVLQALGGAAARGGAAAVTTDDIKVFVEDQVPVITEKIFKIKQSPYSSSHGQGFPVVTR